MSSERKVASQYDVFNAFSARTKKKTKKEPNSKNTRKNYRTFRPLWHTDDEQKQEAKKSVSKGSPGYQDSLNGRRTDISTMSKEDLEKAEMRSNTKELQFDPEETATPKSKAGVVELTYNSIGLGQSEQADFLKIPPPPYPPPEDSCEERRISSATEDLIEDQLKAINTGTETLDKLEKDEEEPKEERSMKFRISRMSINEAQKSRNSVRSTRSTMINGKPRVLTKNSGKSTQSHVTRVSTKHPKKASMQSMDLDLVVKAKRSTDRESFEGSPPPPPPMVPARRTRKNGSFASFEAIPPPPRQTRISQSELEQFASSTKSKGFQHVNSAKKHERIQYF